MAARGELSMALDRPPSSRFHQLLLVALQGMAHLQAAATE